MDYQHILYDYQAGRARVTLNRPEKRNALSGLALKELHHALWRADEDNRVHCVILAGAGKDFCSGYDLNHYKSAEAGAHEERRGHQSFDDDAWHLERSLDQRMPLFDMHKPTIAQVHGRCLAGGTDLALLCDMVICADDAQFGFPALRSQGSPPNHMWLYHLGPQWAKRLLLTGDSLMGVDAAALGLALKSVPAERLAAEDEFTSRLQIAMVLARWGADDWAEREYRGILDNEASPHATRALTAILCSEFLHDRQRHADAAAVLTADEVAALGAVDDAASGAPGAGDLSEAELAAMVADLGALYDPSRALTAAEVAEMEADLVVCRALQIR